MPKSFIEHDKEESQKAVFSCPVCVFVEEAAKAKSTFSFSLPSIHPSIHASQLAGAKAKLVYQKVLHWLHLVSSITSWSAAEPITL